MDKRLQAISDSKYFDVIGIAIVLVTVWVLGYYKTPLSASWLFRSMHNPILSLPLIGIISTLSSIASIMSTRLTAKLNNWGNIIGWMTAFFSGLVDFLLGNVGAILTYPVSVYLNWQASYNWKNKYAGRFGYQKNFAWILTGIIIGAFVLGFGLNYIAYAYLAHWPLDVLFYFASITFTLSLIANVLNVLKLPSQWSFWAVYNLAQLGKSLTLRNYANVAKYAYYIMNSVIAGVSWLLKKATQAQAASRLQPEQR
ncbi:nicotinamide mononucleotide transporter [Leuconostocaceae bacterium ESL0723]|nr:nicotinamide mononucleotide transporter [Leuconostocaceae bacterium ESL0723]